MPNNRKKYYQFLDDVLQYLNNNSTHKEKSQTVFEKAGFVNTTVKDVEIALDKLVSDGYAESESVNKSDPPQLQYYISANGLLFLDKNGYSHKFYKERLDYNTKTAQSIALFVFAAIGAIYTLTNMFPKETGKQQNKPIIENLETQSPSISVDTLIPVSLDSTKADSLKR